MDQEDQSLSFKDKILRYALKRFLSEGFYQIPMDDIAKDMSMSKKTIYKFYSAKEKLVESVLEFFMNQVFKYITTNILNEKDVIIRITKLMKMVGILAQKMSSRWMQDVQIHAPHLFKKMDEFRKVKIYGVFIQIMNDGIQEGYFKNLPPEITATLFTTFIRSIANPEFILSSGIAPNVLLPLAFEILVSGLLTQSGREKWEEYKNKSVEINASFLEDL